MSALLNHNERAYYSWKGKTFTQITSTIKQNNLKNVAGNQIFSARPLNIYRREIASINPSECNVRPSSTILGTMDTPGSSIVNSAVTNQAHGLVNTADFNLTSNLYERPGTCSAITTNGVCFGPEMNARRRVRSSGNIKKNFNVSKNNDTYYTSASQYMVSRNRTFGQNQYNYIRQGNVSGKPGDAATVQNVYATNTPNHCAKFNLPFDTSFQYQWIDSTYSTVIVPAGDYVVDDLNAVLQNTMAANQHYYLYTPTQTKVFLIRFDYANLSNKIQLTCFKTDRFTFDTVTASAQYAYPDGTNTSWRTPDHVIAPVVVVSANAFQTMIGFSPGNYPSQVIRYAPSATSGKTYQYFDGSSYQSPAYLVNQVLVSNMFAGLQRNYVPVYYKPNNSQFAQQGGVTSSSYITRLKYDTMTNNGYKFREAYGNNVANAMAYGVSDSVYTQKDKIGYPNICSPKFDPVTGKMINGKSCASK